MANFTKDFQGTAPHTVSKNVTTFLQTAPAKTPVSISWTVNEGAFYVIVLYTE